MKYTTCLFLSIILFLSLNLKAEIGNGLGEIGEVLSDKLEVACANNQSIKVGAGKIDSISTYNINSIDKCMQKTRLGLVGLGHFLLHQPF